MHHPKGLTPWSFDDIEDIHGTRFEDELLGQGWLELYVIEILMQGINGLSMVA